MLARPRALAPELSHLVFELRGIVAEIAKIIIKSLTTFKICDIMKKV